VTWGLVVLAPAAAGRLRTVLIFLSTFWAFAGVTSVHNIYMRLLHTFVLTDLLLVAGLLAVALMPLAQFAPLPPQLPRLRPGTGDDSGSRDPLLGDGVPAGVGATT
jgi:hypothetical protein